MGRFVKGDVVVTPFPYSDLSDSKKRPALVVAALKGDDVILCQITSRAIGDDYSISIDDKDFASGGLKKPSNVRPNRLFTADSNLILYRAGGLSSQKVESVMRVIFDILKS
jgi:mRNA interferase MazF